MLVVSVLVSPPPSVNVTVTANTPKLLFGVALKDIWVPLGSIVKPKLLESVAPELFKTPPGSIEYWRPISLSAFNAFGLTPFVESIVKLLPGIAPAVELDVDSWAGKFTIAGKEFVSVPVILIFVLFDGLEMLLHAMVKIKVFSADTLLKGKNAFVVM